jgi:hypothetical protein
VHTHKHRRTLKAHYSAQVLTVQSPVGPGLLAVASIASVTQSTQHISPGTSEPLDDLSRRLSSSR